ncbi:hypothetical protein ACIRBZ_31250 [Streptomyces sp. NPDC094038]|uniref:hypothetical protein n=1 Tax=Streptomyces sp. NPDC094038 TaxID=3366055 RepID=UPI00382BA187
MAPARTALTARLLASPTPGTGELAVFDLGFAAAVRGAAAHIIDRVLGDPHLLLAARRGCRTGRGDASYAGTHGAPPRCRGARLRALPVPEAGGTLVA